MTQPTQRMLFISPAFFGYENDIREAIEAKGVRVDYFDERPSNASVAKAVFRLGGRFARILVDAYYRAILKSIAGRNYDFVVVIKGEVVPPSFLDTMRERHPKARFIYYSFDAIPPSSNCTQLFDKFEVLYSFDPADVAKYDGFQLKPLFYSASFHDGGSGNERPYDLTFVGTMHSDRYRFVTNLLRAFETTFRFFYVPARWFFFFNKHISRQFSATKWSEVSFTKLNKDEVASIFRSSHAVLDLQRGGQSGLTMRTFEVIASGAILVTGNATIKDADFYDPSRIVVVDDYDSEAASAHLRATLESLPPGTKAPHGFEQYALGNWVQSFIA